ncbi:flagellar biosynthesis/type III secretory pathway protein FliH [Oxalobacteraceae bacterium GrIS 1.11]
MGWPPSRPLVRKDERSPHLSLKAAMNDFCVAKITPEALLRMPHGILRAEGLSLTLDARAAAAHIMQEAREQAEQLLQVAREQARGGVQEAERQALIRVHALLATLEARHTALLSGAEALVSDLALALFERLVAATTPRERVAANCRRLMQEAPRLMKHPVLWLHPDDSPLLPELDWEVKLDPTLRPGSCRLEAGDGEWRSDFSEGVAALKAAFDSTAPQVAVEGAPQDAVEVALELAPQADAPEAPQAS